jgi:5'-3' exonuclease
MIIVDYSPVVIGTMYAQTNNNSAVNKNDGVSEDLIRHQVLNAIRGINEQFKDKYGTMVIACDSYSWRRDYFPNYKSKRREKKVSTEDTTNQWKEIHRIMDMVKKELNENFPYIVIETYKAEADDIIGTLCEMSQKRPHLSPVMIVSGDKDFIQLHRFKNVKQYSPMMKKYLKENNPVDFLQEHIIRGDSSDGVPNMLSNDDVFINNIRQSAISKKRLNEIKAYLSGDFDTLHQNMPTELYRNYIRNRKLIDLTEAPVEVKERIRDAYNAEVKRLTEDNYNAKILNFLARNKCKNLINNIEGLQNHGQLHPI